MIWSPIHSDNFFADNLKKFEEKDFEPVRQMVAILKTSTKLKDETTLEVVC